MKSRKQSLVLAKLLNQQREMAADAATATALSDTTVALGDGKTATQNAALAAKRHSTSALADNTAPEQSAAHALAPAPQRTALPVERAPRKRKDGRARKLTQADQAELRMREAQASAYAAKYRELLQWAQLSKLLEQDTAVEVLADSAGDLARTGRY